MFPSPVPHRVAVHRCGADEEARDIQRTMAGARAGSVHSVMPGSVSVRLARILSHRWLSAARAARRRRGPRPAETPRVDAVRVTNSKP